MSKRDSAERHKKSIWICAGGHKSRVKSGTWAMREKEPAECSHARVLQAIAGGAPGAITGAALRHPMTKAGTARRPECR
jgi:hypothetical protein